MNALLSFLTLFPFLDVIYDPVSYYLGQISPATKAVLIVVLLLFLGFIGYLIWNSIRKKDKK